MHSSNHRGLSDSDPQAQADPELPIVHATPALKQDVEIYGDYVGRVRAQQFVEVRARVEGFLEQMLFEEGTQVKRNQVLFIINQDQYQAKVDKARAQLKKRRGYGAEGRTRPEPYPPALRTECGQPARPGQCDSRL